MSTSPLPRPTDLDAAARRSFLKKVAIGGAAVAIGTQVGPLRAFAQEGEGDDGTGTGDASGDGSAESPGEGGATSDTTTPGSESESEETVELTPDEQRVTFLAGIGLAAAAAYRAATGDEAPAGEGDDEGEGGAAEGGGGEEAPSSTTTLPPITVPPLAEPVVEVLRVFGSHHSQQAAALGGLLAAPVDAPNSTLVTEVRSALDGAADEAAVLTILRELEERIAATHLQAIADMEDVNDAKIVVTALPVTGQHAVVLGRIGATPTPLEELVPEEQGTEGALDEAAYPTEGTTSPEDTPGESDEDTNAGGEGADPDTSASGGEGDGTESSGGGATSGTDSGAGGASDPESEG